MTPATWGELIDGHCAVRWIKRDEETLLNPRYEDMATRRYNYAATPDVSACRLVFLRDVLIDAANKTLVRKGRFIWCRNLKYEGRSGSALRHISFTVDQGKKRFVVAEDNVLCLPAKTFVNNNRYFRQKGTTFKPFASVFGYNNSLNMMVKNSGLTREELMKQIHADNPHKPGTLVAPRRGYFYPTATPPSTPLWREIDHPYGIILASSVDNNDYAGREFYRVKFGGTIYEKVHPVELEIINEV